MICVLGDAHLDVVVRLADPVSQATLDAETDTPATTSVGAGGQGANVAAWVAALGASSRLITARGTDPGAEIVSAELGRRGVDVVGPRVDGRTGVVVSLSSDGLRSSGLRRAMLTDRGVAAMLAPAHIRACWLGGCGWLHVSGYALGEQPVRDAALAAVTAARDRSARVSVDLASTALIESVGARAFGALLARIQPDAIFGNGAEVALLDGLLAADNVIVKLGPDGIRAGGSHFPALPTDPVDVTGAGDAFAAGYLVGGVALGLSAAARAVAKMGAMP